MNSCIDCKQQFLNEFKETKYEFRHGQIKRVNLYFPNDLDVHFEVLDSAHDLLDGEESGPVHPVLQP